MNLPKLSVVTPTWNRRHLLPRLYDSLVAQDCPPTFFEWIIIDDGSTDGSYEYLREIALSVPFSMKVIRQENGGKSRALNRATKELSSPWVLIVDSDDWLLPGGLSRALSEIAAAENDESVKAIFAPRAFENDIRQSRPPPHGTVTFAQWQSRYWDCDTSDIIRSSLFRDFPFPEFDGEIYASPSSSWARMFKDGGIRLSNTRIIGAEYQPDGLSARSLQLRSSSPLSALATYDAQLKAGLSGRFWLRSQLNYHRFYWHARKAGASPEAHGFSRQLIWSLPAWLFYMRDRRALRQRA